MTKQRKEQLILCVLAILLWGITFYTDTKLFTNDPLNMNCLPIDTGMVTLMHILTKLGVLALLSGGLFFLRHLMRRPQSLAVFAGLLLIYVAGLLITYPGYYMSDDPIIFAYATRYYPVYWHNYLTSLFYMIGMSLFPASCGPVLLSDLLYAAVYTYLFEKTKKCYASKWSYLILLTGILPFTLLGALMCFRPAVYSSFFLFYFVYLFFEWKEKARLTPPKFVFLSLLTAVLSLWRSESIVLLPLGGILIGLTYANTESEGEKKHTPFRKTLKKYILFVLASCVLFTVIKLPQAHGEKTYYGSDYLIISTTRPLSVIVHRDQTYPGAEEDLANISAVTDFGYLHNDSLSCSAYNRYNSDHNEGRYTQTGADAALQKAYLKSAMRLILHNLDLFFGERLQLFCVTNGIFDYNQDMVLQLKPVVTTNFHLYDHDRSYGFEMLDAYKRLPVSSHEGYALSLFRYGGESYIPMLLLLAGLLIYALCRRQWFLFFCFGTLFAREAVIFLTAPASFIQYSYPMMYVTAAFFVLLLIEALCASRTKGR